MNTRIMAVALVVVSLVAVSAVQADEVELVAAVPFLSESIIGTDKTFIVLGKQSDETLPFADCGTLGNDLFDSIEVIVIPGGYFCDPSCNAPDRMTIHQRADLNLAPGTRLGNWFVDTVECCLDANESVLNCAAPGVGGEMHRLAGHVIEPASAGSALFRSAVELNADSIGVVTGQPNDDGTYKVIFKKQGSPAQQVDIATDDVLLAADVLRDLIDLGCDDDTGEHLYLADIEY